MAPLVTSVSVNGLTISKVHAATAASSSLRADDGKKDDHKKDDHKKKHHKKKRCRNGEEWDPVKKQCAPREPECPNPTTRAVRVGDECEPQEPICDAGEVLVGDQCCPLQGDVAVCEATPIPSPF